MDLQQVVEVISGDLNDPAAAIATSIWRLQSPIAFGVEIPRQSFLQRRWSVESRNAP
jgi:hypothetical protein